MTRARSHLSGKIPQDVAIDGKNNNAYLFNANISTRRSAKDLKGQGIIPLT